MKLRLKSNPSEIFDAPRGVGLALIATGTVEAYTEPAPLVKPEVKWNLIGAADRDLFFQAECNICHQGSTFAEPRTPFTHCGRKDFAPDDLADRLRAHLAKRAEAVKPAPSQSTGEMHWVE
jgi:hypothetical protein